MTAILQEKASAADIAKFVDNIISLATEEIAKKHEHSDYLAEFLARAMREK